MGYSVIHIHVIGDRPVMTSAPQFEPTSSMPIFKRLYLVVYKTLALTYSVLLKECQELSLCKFQADPGMFSYQNRRGLSRPILRPLWLMTLATVCLFWVVVLMIWWRLQTETFSTLLALCAGNLLVTGEFPSQRPLTRRFDVLLISTWTNSRVNNREAITVTSLKWESVEFGTHT